MNSRPRQALLLAAGLGTRLKPLTDRIPKCLVPIGGRPLLEHWLSRLASGGVESFVINTHYFADQVETFCRSSPWAHQIRLVHEPELLGTAGTLRANADCFSGSGPFVLAHADNLSIFNLDDFSGAHAKRPNECIGTMMTFLTDRPKDCGILIIDDAGVVQRVYEKVENPPGNLANAAVFILDDAVVDWVVAQPAATDFCRDVVPPLAGRWFTFFNDVYHRDIGTPEALARAESDRPWTKQ